MDQFGLTADYFQNLSFLNEKHSLVYYAVFMFVFFFTGGFIPMIIASTGALLIAIILNRLVLNKRQPLPPNTSVVITGCSTGIGAATAVRFATQDKIKVFATFRKMADFDTLVAAHPEAKPNILPIILDVTKKETIAAGVKEIESQLKQQQLTLLGLINNSGYGQTSFLESVPEEKMRYQFDVNVFGLIDMTNATLPLLRDYRPANTVLQPKIINIASIMTHFTTATAGLYAGTKHCLKAISDGYRQELCKQGIDVVSIQPGLIDTNFQSTLQSQTNPVDEEKRDTPVDWYYSEAQLALKKLVPPPGSPATLVASVLEDVIHSPAPHAHYQVGKDAHLMYTLLPWVWDRAWDLVSTPSFKSLSAFDKNAVQPSKDQDVAKKID